MWWTQEVIRALDVFIFLLTSFAYILKVQRCYYRSWILVSGRKKRKERKNKTIYFLAESHFFFFWLHWVFVAAWAFL